MKFLAILGLSLLFSCAQNDLKQKLASMNPQESEQSEIKNFFFYPSAKSINRQPAADLIIPYAPGTVTSPHNPPTNPPSTNPTPQVPNPPVAEAPGGCPVPLNQIPIGGTNRHNYGRPFTVMDLLLVANNHRTVTQEGLQGDIELLRPWFKVNSNLNSSIYSALQKSPAWCRAVEFISGVRVSHCAPPKEPDISINYRMSLVLVSLMATGYYPECIRQVRDLAAKVLGPNIGEIDEALMPFDEVATHLRAGTFKEKFKQLDDERKGYEKQIKDVDQVIKQKEKENYSAQDQSRRDLRAAYRAIRRELTDVPPCLKIIDDELNSMDRSTPQDVALEKLPEKLAECRIILRERIENFTDQIVDDAKNIERYETERSQNPSQRVTYREEAARKHMADREKKVKLYEEYLLLLDDKNPETSISAKADKVVQVIGSGRQVMEAAKNKSYLVEEQKQKADYQAKLDQLSSRYLTYGFLGGFGNLQVRNY